MQVFRIDISGDRWPTQFTIMASDWTTAVGRASREWKKKNKGSRSTKFTIHIYKNGQKETSEIIGNS